jgi:hypothetical protein
VAPGDLLYFPDPVLKKLPWVAKSDNTFRVDVPSVTVDVSILKDGPVVGECYRVVGVSPPVTGTTDAQGRARFEVPIHVRSVRLLIPARGIQLPIRIGDLDPIEEITGVRMRLQHLGYYGHYGDGASAEPVETRDLRAIRAFQADRKLPVTGKLDEGTVAALKHAHRS